VGAKYAEALGMMNCTKNSLAEEVDNLHAQKATNEFGSKMEEMAKDQVSKLQLRRLQAELGAIRNKIEQAKRKSQEELDGLMLRYQEVRREYNSKLA